MCCLNRHLQIPHHEKNRRMLHCTIAGYALVVETIFGWAGVGQALVNAVLRRDYPVVQLFSLLLVALVTFGNLMATVGYTIANPRLRKYK